MSAELRTYAGIDKSLMLVGQGTHFELWSKDSWEEEIKQVDINQENELPEELGGFSL